MPTDGSAGAGTGAGNGADNSGADNAGSRLTGSNAGNGSDGGSSDPGSFDQGDWRASFASGFEEAVGDPDEAGRFRAWLGRYASPKDFTKGIWEMRKGFGERVALPNDKSKPEDWDHLFDRLGRPKEPAGYAWQHLEDAPPLNDAEREAAESFKMIAHREGLLPRQVQAIVKWNDEQRKLIAGAQQEAVNVAYRNAAKMLETEWGPDLKDNLEIANNQGKAFFGKDFDAIVNTRLEDGSFLGDNPHFVRVLHAFAMAKAEESRDAAYIPTREKETIQEQIDALETEAMQKGLAPSSPQWPHAKLDPLYKKLRGTRNLGPRPALSR